MQQEEAPALPLLGFLVFTLALSLTQRQPGGAGGTGGTGAEVVQVAQGTQRAWGQMVQVAQGV